MNKGDRNLEQLIKGLKHADERRNLISKLNLTLKIGIQSIRAYEATTKHKTHYKNSSEGKGGT